MSVATHVPDQTCECPADVEEASAVLRETGGPIQFRGAGTKLDWCGRVTAPHRGLSTQSMTGVLTHNAADMTASFRAGTSLASLQQHLAEHDQWLALDPPTTASGASIGGLLSAGDSGPSRLRYGGLRDLVIGVTLVLADGTVAHSGGHVIKNVAGYDLAKLVHGSLGSLALVAEVVLRLHPKPPMSATVAGSADVAQASAAARRLAASALEPAAVEWVDTGSGPQFVVRLDGSPRSVAAAARDVIALLGALGVPAEQVQDDAALRLWAEHASIVNGRDGDTVLRLATLPSDLVSVAAHLDAIAAETGVSGLITSGVATGLHTLRLHGAGSRDVARAATSIRDHALGLGGSVQVRRRPESVDEHLDALGPPPDAVQLLRRVKAQFDPTGRLAPGRFQPWY